MKATLGELLLQKVTGSFVALEPKNNHLLHLSWSIQLTPLGDGCVSLVRAILCSQMDRFLFAFSKTLIYTKFQCDCTLQILYKARFYEGWIMCCEYDRSKVMSTTTVHFISGAVLPDCHVTPSQLRELSANENDAFQKWTCLVTSFADRPWHHTVVTGLSGFVGDKEDNILFAKLVSFFSSQSQKLFTVALLQIGRSSTLSGHICCDFPKEIYFYWSKNERS